MNIEKLNTRDVEILYSFPMVPSDAEAVIRCFKFINRTSAPTYEEFANCVTKAQEVGIIRVESGKFVVEGDWYNRIHAADHSADNEIESMLEFQDKIINKDLVRVANATYVPSIEEYQSVVVW